MKLRIGKRNWKRVTVGGVAAIALTVSSLAFFWNQPVQPADALSAYDRSGANEGWFKSSARFVLEDDAQVSGANSTIIPFYVLNTQPTATAASKPPSNMTVRVDSFSKGYIGNTLSAVQFRWGGSLCTAQTAGYWNSGSQTFQISKGCFVYKESLNAWVVNVTANLRDAGGVVQFRTHIEAPNTGNELIGYDADNGDRGFAVASQGRCDYGGDTSGCGQYYDFGIPFGTPCTETNTKTVSATIFDGDNVTGSQYTVQGGVKFWVQFADVTYSSAGTVIPHSMSGSEGNGQLARYTFTVEPGHKYRMRIFHVYTNNVLQFKLPYNSIESVAQCRWDIDPATTLNANTAEPNSSGIDVTYGVTNNGNTQTNGVSWQLTRCRVPASASGAAYGKVPDNTSNGVTTYNALGNSCSQVRSGSGGKYAASHTFIGLPGSVLKNQTIGDEPVGTRICYILSVHPPTNASGDSAKWRHSKPACVTVIKKPKVQVWGSDLLVGRGSASNGAAQSNVITSTSSRNGSYYGSWAEYAIIPSGTVTGMASGAGYVGGATTGDLCALSALTFTNSSGCGTIGQYVQATLAPNVSARFPINTAAGDATPSRPADPAVLPSTSLNLKTSNLSGAYQAPANAATLTISGGTSIAKGRWIVINAPNSTIRITGNITYTTEALHALSDVPQVVLIAKNIVIADSVTQIDAWLVTTGSGTGVCDTSTLNNCEGRVNTCGIGSDNAAVTETNALIYTQCNKKLTVNGPVIANHLIMRRTAGSGTGDQIGDPAEVFNLRADAFIWVTGYNLNSGRIPTAQTTELPPRF